MLKKWRITRLTFSLICFYYWNLSRWDMACFLFFRWVIFFGIYSDKLSTTATVQGLWAFFKVCFIIKSIILDLIWFLADEYPSLYLWKEVQRFLFYINKIIPLCIRVMVDEAPVISHMYFTWRKLRRDLLQSQSVKALL